MYDIPCSAYGPTPRSSLVACSYAIARLRNVCYDESVRSLILAVVAVSDKARRFVIDL